MGFENDHQIMSSVAAADEEKYQQMFAQTLEECRAHHISTKEQALAYVTSKVRAIRKFLWLESSCLVAER